MTKWTVDEALKWADTWGPTDGEPPTGDQLALATLARVVRAAGAELASMRQCFEAAERERSELRERAERAEAERDAQHAKLLPLLALAQEVVSIAQHGCLLDGDGVNAPTLLWAEEWQRRILGPNAELAGQQWPAPEER